MGDWLLASGVSTSGVSSAATSSWTTNFGGNCAVANTHLLCLSNVVVVFADRFESGGPDAWSGKFP